MELGSVVYLPEPPHQPRTLPARARVPCQGQLSANAGR